MSNPIARRYMGEHYAVAAMREMIAAMSALNMHPKPFKKPKGKYLSERDHWAKHSHRHIEAAVKILRQWVRDRREGRCSE